ncbi:MAG: substrate-binding domain-containing protein, partial [Eubacteriales bacterium]
INQMLKWTFIILSGMVMILIILMIFQQKIGAIGDEIADDLIEYENYYVLIADESDDILWESVYQGAVLEGEEEANAYVDFIEGGDSAEYSMQEKMRIAIDSKVEGIIVCSDSLEETTTLIDEAVEKGISVVTVINDDSNSLRKSYVGVNNYTLGETYGSLIWDYVSQSREEETDCKVAILMDSFNEDTGKNTTYLGMREYLNRIIEEQEWPYEIDLETVAINREEIFVAEETIGNIIVAGDADMMICLNAVDTETAYRSIVDYNLVGTIEILGYYESEVILEAIEKNIIYATISINGEEVGKQSVRAIQEYQEFGYVNGYFPVETQVIDKSNVTIFLDNYTDISEVEDE